MMTEDENKTYGGSIALRVPRSLHKALVEKAAQEGVSLNQFLATTLAGAIGWRGSLPAGRRAAIVDRLSQPADNVQLGRVDTAASDVARWQREVQQQIDGVARSAALEGARAMARLAESGASPDVISKVVRQSQEALQRALRGP